LGLGKNLFSFRKTRAFVVLFPYAIGELFEVSNEEEKTIYRAVVHP
jgi:hypothetical protein